jgi:hypothetical protein
MRSVLECSDDPLPHFVPHSRPEQRSNPSICCDVMRSFARKPGMGTYNHPLACVQSRTRVRAHLRIHGSFAWVLAENIQSRSLWTLGAAPSGQNDRSGEAASIAVVIAVVFAVISPTARPNTAMRAPRLHRELVGTTSPRAPARRPNYYPTPATAGSPSAVAACRSPRPRAVAPPGRRARRISLRRTILR